MVTRSHWVNVLSNLASQINQQLLSIHKKYSTHECCLFEGNDSRVRKKGSVWLQMIVQF